jgi:Flp pilus assembly protein TadG
MLEFAFAASILMALFLGIFVFARAYNTYQTMTRAAREGARMAVLPTSVADGNNNTYVTYTSGNSTFTMGSCSSTTAGTNNPGSPTFTNFVAPALQASSLSPSNVTNYVECAQWLDPNNTQCGITISFTYPYELDIPFTSTRFQTINLHTSVTMRLENPGVTQQSDGSYAETCP